MRPSLPSLLISVAMLGATGELAAAPPQVIVDSARVILGPGMAPSAGAAPFQPRLEARFSLTGPAKAGCQFRFWRASAEALATLQKGRPIRVGSAGFLPLKGRAKPLDRSGRFHVTALSPEPWSEPQSLVVEVLLKGRLQARGSAPIDEQNLPATRGREEMKP